LVEIRKVIVLNLKEFRDEAGGFEMQADLVAGPRTGDRRQFQGSLAGGDETPFDGVVDDFAGGRAARGAGRGGRVAI